MTENLRWISRINHIRHLLTCRLHREHFICSHQFSAPTHDDGVSVTIASSIFHFVQSSTFVFLSTPICFQSLIGGGGFRFVLF